MSEATSKGEKWLHKLLLVADCMYWGEAHGLSVCTEEPLASIPLRVLIVQPKPQPGGWSGMETGCKSSWCSWLPGAPCCERFCSCDWASWERVCGLISHVCTRQGKPERHAYPGFTISVLGAHCPLLEEKGLFLHLHALPA